ncbi:MAG: cytidylate kinase-like family protein [Clostridiales bacterium]|nr:cytidylate kinase-like family protein [Clostridiales bacterium]
MREHTLITISRQYGSAGKEAAEHLARKMKVRCYDRQILYLAADKLGKSDLDIETILEISYKKPKENIGSIFESIGSLGFDTIPSYNEMYKEQAKVIREIAKKESAVFVGRCADAILKDFPECYRFFVYAEDEFREQRAKEFYDNLSLKELEKEDKMRERYYNYYTGQKWGDPNNYDLMINASQLSPEKIAELIWKYVEFRQNQ